jgi:SAM-dependent methyltransferase
VTAQRLSATAAEPVSPMPAAVRPGSRRAAHDPRWPALAARLALLREQRRRAVRIVDADCGAGTLLVHAVLHARSLGFTAIEGRGIDGSPALIGRANAAAARLRDPAIGLAFEAADMVGALGDERECPADIVLWHGSTSGRECQSVSDALARAGDLVIGDGSRSFTR